ncbi:ephrin-B3b isoform X2 [Erpetoichthys calabaricus]|uniref:ephrin-B3b isoform X2 n=1 Tax=Erpetoichthys calabaricus TaxID=27687 RepID=UPI0010A07A81|nr:ephrin-B3b isoform X2 [Erpetoichthys calabaricus]
MAFRNDFGGLLMLLLLALDVSVTSGTNLEPIYWNSLNKRFNDEKGYVLYPQIGDRLDLICPASLPPGPHSTEEYEYYKLYLVSTREQAERCEIIGAPNLLLTCDKPTSDMRFTIKFQEYSPNLWGHEFKTQHDYYIITTSDGTRQGLESIRGGSCQSKGMKVILKVGQSSSGNSTNKGNGENGPLPASNIPIIAGAAGGSAFLLIIAIIIAVVCYRRRQSKHSDTHHPPLSLSTLTSPKRGGNNNGSEPSDIIIPLRTSDSAFCPHYEKVSGDYGHPVYIVQEMPPQSPANIYYKV